MARAPAPIYDRMDFPDYSFREFPKMLYAFGKAAVTVQNAKEETALGKGWFSHPQNALFPYVEAPEPEPAAEPEPEPGPAPTGSLKAILSPAKK